MNKNILLSISILTGLVSAIISTPAAAECYGDAADMYGCGAQGSSKAARRTGELERFGGDDAPVLPNVGYQNQGGTASDIVTVQESRKMLRSIVLGSRGTSPYSRRTHIRAMNSSAQPLRRAGSVNMGGMGGGGGR